MRVWFYLVFSLFAIHVLSACGEDKAVVRAKLDPATTRAVLGKAMIGIDDRIIVLCDSRQGCTELPERVCALDMNDQVGNALRAFRDHVGGEYWITGHAVVASLGQYGHVGSQTCLVTFKNVTGVDDGPPRLWTPPPPSNSSGS